MIDTETEMSEQPLFVATRHGDRYRGEILDGRTYRTIVVTAHLYPNETIAKVAAKRLWLERQPQEQVA